MPFGVVIVIVLDSLWSKSALPGGIGVLLAVAGMLLPGTIKGGSRAEPIVVTDQRGVTIDLPRIGTIPWDRIRSAKIDGSAWWSGQRLIIEYTGTAPEVRSMDRVNWGFKAQQNGEVVRLTLGYVAQTDQPKSTIEAALNKSAAHAA